jgi:hypothetical protein
VTHYRANWIRKLTSLGLKPKITFLRVCSSDEYEKYETEYINIYYCNRLTNSDENGSGNKNRKREILDRQSESMGRKVYQYDLEGNLIEEYRSVRTAAKELNLNHANISRCCNGVSKHAGGYIFRYEKIEVDKVENPNAVKKMVIEIDKNGVEIGRWSSIMACSRSTGMNNGNISRVCNGVFNSTRGRFFKFS